jgi:hypothetical protein
MPVFGGGNGGGSIAKMLTDLNKFYTNELKFGGEFYDVLNAKLKVFYELCYKAGVIPENYNMAYGTMFKGKAQDFYYQHLSSQNLTFEKMVEKTREYFHTTENHQQYLNEWRTTMLRDVIAANFDKNLPQCLELLINKLQKVHQSLVYNYNSTEGNLAGQLMLACQGVATCTNVLIRPFITFESVVADLRSAVNIWAKCRLGQRAYTTFIDNLPSGSLNTGQNGDNSFYTNRKYGRNDGFRRSRGRSKGRYRGGYNDRKTGNKRYFICGKQNCWFIRYSVDKRQNYQQYYRTYVQNRELNENYEAFFGRLQGHKYRLR